MSRMKQGIPGFPQPPHSEDQDSRIVHSFDFTSTALRDKELESSTAMEQEAELRHKHDMNIEMRGTAQIEQENWDKIRLKTAEERITELESTFAYFQGIGNNIISAYGTGATLALSYYGVKHIFVPIFRFLGYRLGKPSLVRKTSRFTVGSAVRHPIKAISQLIQRPEDLMKDIILKPTLEEKLRGIAKVTRSTQTNGGNFRNMLLRGPPGTGKLMFAKSLAQHLGMHYAVLNGKSVAPMGEEAVTAVHRLFDWALTSRKGMVLFVDEADAFLSNRNTEMMSVDMRAALAEFLYRTRDRSHKIMLLLATNHPERFDVAIASRFDDVVEFEVPSYEERERLVRHYFQKFIHEQAASKSGQLLVVEFDFEKKCAEIAEKTDGLSGQEISMLWKFCQARTSKDGVLTEEIVNGVIKYAIQHHKQDVDWQLRQDMSSLVKPASKEPVTSPPVQQPGGDAKGYASDGILTEQMIDEIIKTAVEYKQKTCTL